MGGQRMVSWVGVLTGLAVVVGFFCSLLWARIVHLPTYAVGDDHIATMSERGHTEVFASDAWFVFIGLIAGALLGTLAWSWFRTLGWPVVVIAAGAGLVSGLVCWQIGQLWGPGSFESRLAHAAPGDLVPIAFVLHAPATLAGWALAAVAPSLFASTLGPEQSAELGDPGPRGRSIGSTAEWASSTSPANERP